MADDAKLVFSTDGQGDLRKSKDSQAKNSKTNPAKSSPGTAGTVKMRLESAGRGGKQVTVLFALVMGDQEAKGLLKELQDKLGTGGTYKEGRLEFRGDVRDRIEVLLSKRGLKTVRAGG